MEQTVIVKLDSTDEQHDLLIRTMRTFNAACDHIASVAFRLRTANKVRVQRESYREVREQFGLSSQMTIRAIAKTCDAYKRDTRTMPRFRPTGAMVYDQRVLSWKGRDAVSILTLDGRVVVPVRMGDRQRERFDRPRGQVKLVLRKRTLYLHIVVDAPEAPELEPASILGVDIGIVNLAVDSDGDVHSGRPVDAVRARIDRLRSRLQKRGTRSAKRHLRKLSGRGQGFMRDTNHVISKRLVAKAKGTRCGIALEDLKGIRDRKTVRKAQRRRLESWSFNQLQRFIHYKAKLAGVPVFIVDPRYTSTTCPVCGCIDRENRPFRGWFQCVTCGFAGSADHVAATNIAARGAVNPPFVTGVASHICEPRPVANPPFSMVG